MCHASPRPSRTPPATAACAPSRRRHPRRRQPSFVSSSDCPCCPCRYSYRLLTVQSYTIGGAPPSNSFITGYRLGNRKKGTRIKRHTGSGTMCILYILRQKSAKKTIWAQRFMLPLRPECLFSPYGGSQEQILFYTLCYTFHRKICRKLASFIKSTYLCSGI